MSHTDILYLNLNDPKACNTLQNKNSEISVLKNLAKKKQEEVIQIPSCEDLKKIPADGFSATEICDFLANVDTSRVHSLVISGHDGGGNFDGEVGKLPRPAIQEIFSANRLQNLKGVYLLGCYSNVKHEALIWNDLFSQAKIIAGFDNKSPLNGDARNANLLNDLITIETDVPNELLADAAERNFKKSVLPFTTIIKKHNSCTYLAREDSSKINSPPISTNLNTIKAECLDSVKLARMRASINTIACYRYANVDFPAQDKKASQFDYKLKAPGTSNMCKNIPIFEPKQKPTNRSSAHNILEEQSDYDTCGNYPKNLEGEESHELREAYSEVRKMAHCFSENSYLQLINNEEVLGENPEYTIGLVKFKNVLKNYTKYFKKELNDNKQTIEEINQTYLSDNKIDTRAFTANSNRHDWLTENEKLRSWSNTVIDQSWDYVHRLRLPAILTKLRHDYPDMNYPSPTDIPKDVSIQTWIDNLPSDVRGIVKIELGGSLTILDELPQILRSNNQTQLAKKLDLAIKTNEFVSSTDQYILNTTDCIPASWYEANGHEPDCSFDGKIF